MDERAFWNKRIRPLLERPPHSVANKVQDAHNKGLPDFEYCCRGVAGKVETKYEPNWPARASTPIKIEVSKEQRMQLRRWHNAGGRGYVLLGVEQNWYLFPWHVPQRLLREELPDFALLHGTFDDLERLARYLTDPDGPALDRGSVPVS